MKILAASITRIGGRDYNQDYVLSTMMDEKGACFVCCDGLGSYVGSEVASRMCAEKVISDFEKIATLDSDRAIKKEFFESYIRESHENILSFKSQNPRISSSCTTIACVATNAKNSIIGHIGDSRVYFFKKNKLQHQTLDHSLSQVAVEQGQISLRDIRTHKDQNKLTRVLGSDYYIPPDFHEIKEPLEVGDAFILCTDGFWEYVYEDEMEHDLEISKLPSEALDRMELRLLSRVQRYNDNYSAIVVKVVE
ncbi:MAG: protein phosphatase 2C domain-containing protein [Firmicutes bacterium]|nr:protein phosphatase 2C domain-containing protein [Bacillota bacterium]